MLSLTGLGRSTTQRLQHAAFGLVDERLDHWSHEERETLARLLQRLLNDLGTPHVQRHRKPASEPDQEVGGGP